MSHSESIKATVKVTLTGPDGKALKVIEGENPDPFSLSFFFIFPISTNGLDPTTLISDIFNNLYTFDFYTPSPSSSLGYLVPGFCLINCPNAGSTPPNGPGIWLFETTPVIGSANGWVLYSGEGINTSTLITGLSYSSPTFTASFSTPSSPGDIVYHLYNIVQSMTNTLSSPVNVYTIMLVGAIYGSLSASPIYIPITFYMFSPPVVLSPGVTMTVSVTLSFPFGIAIEPFSEFYNNAS